jgi:uncharacterized protein (TIGR02271 family)
MTTRSDSTSADLANMTGRQVYDAEGNKIGTVGRIYQSDATGEPAWATVTAGLFGSKESIVPLNGVQVDERGLHVTVNKDLVKDAPRVDVESGHLSEAEIADLHRHYGLAAGGGVVGGQAAKGTGALPTQRTEADRETTARHAAPAAGRETAARPGRADAQQQWVMRSEERLRAEVQSVETGRVRLHKRVVTTQETITVPIRHEEIRVIREVIKPGEAGGNITISEEDREVILHEERPMAVKEIVPVERISLAVETIQENREVSDSVRHEEIDIDDDGKQQPRR